MVGLSLLVPQTGIEDEHRTRCKCRCDTPIRACADWPGLGTRQPAPPLLTMDSSLLQRTGLAMWAAMVVGLACTGLAAWKDSRTRTRVAAALSLIWVLFAFARSRYSCGFHRRPHLAKSIASATLSFRIRMGMRHRCATYCAQDRSCSCSTVVIGDCTAKQNSAGSEQSTVSSEIWACVSSA